MPIHEEDCNWVKEYLEHKLKESAMLMNDLPPEEVIPDISNTEKFLEGMRMQPAGTLGVINLHELMNTEWPEEIFIGGGILSRGDRLLLGADSKAGKSTLLMQMLRACCSAKDFLGFQIKKHLKILFMQAELRESRLKERMKATSQFMPTKERERFMICSTRGMVMLTNMEDMKKVENTLEHYKPDIWCIDPMANFHDRDENSSTEMMNFFRLLDRIKERHNLAIIMSTHFRKASSQKPVSVLSMIRGSSALRGWADTNLAIEGNQGDDFQHLEFELRNSDNIHKRVLYYDKITREFKWKDPIVECGKWAIEYLCDKEVKSTLFIKDMMKQKGEEVSHNKSKAQAVKSQLVHMGVLKETVDGNNRFISGLKQVGP